MFWLTNKTKFTKDIVIQDMTKRIKSNANKEWLSLNEYYIIRKERKERIRWNFSNIRKMWNYNSWIRINKVSDFNNIKWWLIEIWWWQENLLVKAYIRWIWRKPWLLWDIDRMTYAEKNKVRKIVYWYFDKL